MRPEQVPHHVRCGDAVVVQRQDPVVPLVEGPTNPYVQGGGDPQVLPVPDHLDAFRVGGLDFQQGVLRLIARPVVHDEDPVDLREDRFEDGQDVATDLEGDDDAGHLRGPERERYDGSGVHDGLSGWFAYATTGGNRGATGG
jgi:hypothetical protein